MKTPRINFNKDALLDFLLAHGEKVVAVVIGLAACGLAWEGVSAFLGMGPSPQQQPEAILDEASKAADYIVKEKNVPPEKLKGENNLSETVARWLSSKVKPAPPHALFNRPLFAELSRRSSPDILPIEDLQAVSGVAVVAMKPKAAGDRTAPDRPLNQEAGNAAKPGRPPRAGGRGGAMPAAPQPGTDTEVMPPRPDQVQSQGKIMPYVLVTGLIPIVKQQEEYDRRFTAAGFRDPARDTPSWNSYRIERTEVLPGTAEKWTPVDTKALARRYSAEWVGIQPEPLLSQLVIPPGQERRDSTLSPIPFCSPLPQLTDGTWGFNALHSWFAEFLQRDAAEKRDRAKAEAGAKADQESAAPNSDVFGGTTAAPFDGAIGVPGGDTALPGGDASGTGPPAMEAPAAKVMEYRLFRFVDFAVLPGRTYRYRVRAVCWNPNLNVPSRHLVDASIAKQSTIESPDSNATAPVAVPDSTRMLVQPMKKEYLKKMKAGVVPAMILGEKPNAGAFSLRALLMEVGGLANVDPSLNKRGDPRSRGDAIVTDRVLLDVRGRLEDRAESRAGKPTPRPEPIELIFLRPDGTFEVASSADSQQDIDRYYSTLPADDAGAAPAPGAGQPPAGVDSPFGNPFAPKK